MPRPGSRVFPGLPIPAIQPRSTRAVALVVGCTAAALALRLAIGYVDPTIPAFATFFASILVSTIIAGAEAGTLAAILGLGIAWLGISGSVPTAFTSAALTLYALTSLAIIWVSAQYRLLLRRLQEREAAAERQLALIAAENEVLGSIVGNAPLPQILERLTRSVEEYSGKTMLASILLIDVDGKHLRHGAAPSLPDDYNRAIDGVEIGPSVGSCGTAAFRKEPVYVSNIATDPLWADFKELALSHGLKACWSTPIRSSSNDVLGTFALYHHEPRSPDAQEKELVDLMTRIAALAIEHERDLGQRQLLVDELTHRVKNMLMVVLSISGSTLRRHSEEAAYKTFQERLIALSKAQDLLTQSGWSSVDLRELVNNALTPFIADSKRLSVEGPTANIPARLTLPFALLLHELCTNASKYGALTTENGRISISWDYPRADKDRKFLFRWSEAGGPPVHPPARQGFGSRLITTAFASDGCEGKADYRPDGFVYEIALPIEHFNSGTSGRQDAASTAQAS
jgi:two-component sensor histidine kinase